MLSSAKEVEAAQEDLQAAEEGLYGTELAAPQIHLKAEQAERDARFEEAQRSMATAKKLNDLAEHLGASDSNWAKKRAAIAWSEKIKRADISAAFLSKQQAEADCQAPERAMQAYGKSLPEIATEAQQDTIEQFKNMPTLKN